jgi:YD repeat-containing protein
MTTTITIIAETARTPGKVAEAELHFAAGILDGLKLIGFAVWQRRTGSGFNVTFPARQYAVNGERRSFALLRPSIATGSLEASARIRDLIVDAYQRTEQHPTITRWTYDEAGQCVTSTSAATTQHASVETSSSSLF